MTIFLTKETVLSLISPPWTHAVGEPHGCAEDSESSSAGVLCLRRPYASCDPIWEKLCCAPIFIARNILGALNVRQGRGRWRYLQPIRHHHRLGNCPLLFASKASGNHHHVICQHCWQ